MATSYLVMVVVGKQTKVSKRQDDTTQVKKHANIVKRTI
jgi:hypothetical protein